jgi:hypothetical protein
LKTLQQIVSSPTTEGYECFELETKLVNKIFNIQKKPIVYNKISAKMIMLKDITSAIKLNEIEREKQFYEVLTATVSHEMKSPLN